MTIRPSVVRALAPAKINLRLEVLGRRGDGYHEVRTWMLALDLCDGLELRPSTSGRVTLSVTGPSATSDVPAGAENLAARAASAVLEEGKRLSRIGAEVGLDLALEKRIPSRAGLGGGSSDAAAAFLASEAALGLAIGRRAAASALADLGSDCAFFAAARETGFAECGARGERVAAARPPSGLFVALVVPAVEAPTREVYAAFDALPPGTRPAAPPGWLDGGALALRAGLWNDLEAAALAAFPDLRRWRDLLDAGRASHWRLSGSGSAFFGIHAGRARAEEELAFVVEAARSAGLRHRGAFACPPAGTGAKIVGIR